MMNNGETEMRISPSLIVCSIIPRESKRLSALLPYIMPNYKLTSNALALIDQHREKDHKERKGNRQSIIIGGTCQLGKEENIPE